MQAIAPINGGGVRVLTEGGGLEAERVVITAGRWVREFAPATDAGLFQTIRQVTFWFDVGDIRAFQPGRFPTYIWGPREGNSGHYGFPAADGELGGIKVASEGLARSEAMERFEREVSQEEIRRMYEQSVRPYLNGVEARCIRAKTCVFVKTPDCGFVFDRHPGCPDAIFTSPCCGIGFKFAPALGELIAGLATGQRDFSELSRFALNRFHS